MLPPIHIPKSTPAMKPNRKPWLLLACLALLPAAHAAGPLLQTEKVAEGIHALIGPLGNRSYENHGLNANFGVIATPEGTILVDSGASAQGAALLAQQAQKLVGKPVRWVINTGSQDHRWLGNGHLRQQGAELIALERTAKEQKAGAFGQMASLKPTLKERQTGTEPVTAPKPLPGDKAVLQLGGRELHLLWLNEAHFPGDIVVWLPREGVLFAGDHVYTDRLLGVLPGSNAAKWLDAFEKMVALKPRRIVPGHGRVVDVAGARRDTGDYLAWLVPAVQKLAEDMAGVDVAVSRLGDTPQFKRLANYDELHRGNISRAYLRFEAGQ
jgi:glyoxylase-like metal-dependent hydrolase (beta-lactamase superfamily II)